MSESERPPVERCHCKAHAKHGHPVDAASPAVPRPAGASWSATCDWGDCVEPSICLRTGTDHDLGVWVSVCRVHIEGAEDDELAPMRDVPPAVPPEGLDVERLARAIAGSTVFGVVFPGEARGMAEDLFTADARLSDTGEGEKP